MHVNLAILIVLITLCPLLLCSVVNPEVSVQEGKLAGLPFTSRNGTRYHGFLGIPFAKPPIGELRFEPPQPPEPWEGVRDASKQPPICVQKDTLTIFEEQSRIQGTEDCLYLNVFTPASAEASSLVPVMVYIHGGAFTTGSAVGYSPDYFMDYAVVTVFIQYRLGILGIPFLMGLRVADCIS